MKELIDIVWKNRDLLKEKKYSDAVKSTLEKLNKGEIKVAEKIDSKWIVNEWVKKAVILFFPLMEMKTIELGPFEFHDKIKLDYPNLGIFREDERFTSSLAKLLIAKSDLKKTKRENKKLIDKISATIILQSFLKKF